MVTLINGSDARRWWALASVSLAVLAVSLDGTVLSVALPTLVTAMHASQTDLEWFSAGYLLALAATVLPAGMLGDRGGRKKLLVVSLALFGLGSAACAFSPTPAAFLAARVLLGVAGAGVTVMAMSALTVLFDTAERPKAVGVFAAANFVALPLGPILGGWMLTQFWWGTLFLINVPVVILGLTAVAFLVPETRGEQGRRVDLVGITTSAVGLVGVTAGLVLAGQDGWNSIAAWSVIVAGVALIVAFFFWERRLTRLARDPLVDMALFSSPSFTWGSVLAGVAGLALIGVIFTMPQYFQGVQGADAFGSGLRLLPLIGGLILGAVPANKLSDRIGSRFTIALGFALLVLGFAVGAMTEVASPIWFTATWMAVTGAGAGIALAAATSAALSNLTVDESGIGSGVVQAIQKVGAPLGTTVLGSVVTVTYQASVGVSALPWRIAEQVRHSLFAGVGVAEASRSSALLDSVRSAFVDGVDRALLVSAGIAVVGCIVAVIFIPRSTTSPTRNEVPVAAS